MSSGYETKKVVGNCKLDQKGVELRYKIVIEFHKLRVVNDTNTNVDHFAITIFIRHLGSVHTKIKEI